MVSREKEYRKKGSRKKRTDGAERMDKRQKLNADTKTMVRFLEGIVEVAALSVLYYFFWRCGHEDDPFPVYLGNGIIVLIGIYAVLNWIFIKNSDGFQFGSMSKFDLGIAQWAAMLIVNIITYFQFCLISNQMLSPLPLCALYFVELFVCTVFIYLYEFINRRLYAAHRMLMIYGRDEAIEMKLKLDKQKERYNVCKLVSAHEPWEKLIKEIDAAESVVVNDVPAELRNDLLKYCYKNQIRIYIVPKITDILIRGARNISAVDTPMLLIRGPGLTIGERFFKRTMDIVLSLVALIITSPIFLVLAIAIKLEDGGPVFYRQKRVTQWGKEFDILKFRSMIVDAEKDGHSIPATERDPRVTKVGWIIRPTRIDELPQVLNILKGDMSIVGPRPERVEHVEKYSAEIPEFVYRLKVKGGLTGYAQIYGKYNTSAYDKLRMDLMYIENYSLLLDIKLMLLTVRVLFNKSSTEGFKVARENEKWREELLEQFRWEETV